MTFERYTLDNEIGRGGFATVYRAHDTELGRHVALKLLHPHLAQDPEYLNQFLTEAQLMAQLDHPHIVPVYDVGQSEGRYYLTMKLMGTSLADRLQQGPLDWDTAVKIFQQIGSGLAYVHEKGMLHRDLKPDNILFDGAGNAAVADFGLAQLTTNSFVISRGSSDAFYGSYPYIAPEIWQGEPATAKSDQYALACVFAKVISGQTLFSAPTHAGYMGAHQRGPTFPEWPTGTPAYFTTALKHALAKDPDQRYPSVSEFVAACLQTASNMPTEPRQPQHSGVHMGKVIIGILATLAVILFVALAAWGISQVTYRAGNSPPNIQAVTPNRNYVTVGETVEITAVVADPDNDPLSYRWSTNYGTIDSSGARITYTAPANPGNGLDIITLTVSDGQATVSQQITLAIQDQ